MKGIIFKELYISRKRIYISIATYLFLTLLCILVKLSASFGNIRLLDKEAVDSTVNITFYFFVFGLLLSIPGMLVNNVCSDLKSHWSIYQRTLPFSEKQIVSAAYISNVVVLLVMNVFHTLMTAVMCALFNKRFQLYYIGVFLAASLLFFVFNAIIMFAFYRFRDSKKAQLFYGAVFTLVYLAFAFAFVGRIYEYDAMGRKEGARLAAQQGLPADAFPPESFQIQYIKEDIHSLAKFMQKFWWAIALLMIAIIILLFFASVKALARPADAVKPSKEKEKTKQSFFGLPRRHKAASEGDDD